LRPFGRHDICWKEGNLRVSLFPFKGDKLCIGLLSLVQVDIPE